MLLRQSTSVDVPIGPFVDKVDGITPETSLTLTQPDIRLKKNNANWVQKNAAQTLTHEESGWYELTLDATDTNTLGVLSVAVNATGFALPVWRDFQIIPALVYDAFVSGSSYLNVNVASLTAAVIAASSFSADAIDSSVLASSAAIEIQQAVNVLLTEATAEWPIYREGEMRPYGGVSGVSDSGSLSTLQDADRTEATNYWNDYTLLITSGPNIGQAATVTGFSSGTLSVNPAFSSAVTSGVSYLLLPEEEVSTGGGTSDLTATQAASAVWTALRADYVGAGTFGEGVLLADDAVTADALATSAVTEITEAISVIIAEETEEWPVYRDGPLSPYSSTPGVSTGVGSTTTLVDTGRTESTVDYWADYVLVLTSGDNIGQAQIVESFNPATDTLTVISPFSSTVSSGVSYLLIAPDADPTFYDWTTDERSQIRHRLGIDGVKVSPASSAHPSLRAVATGQAQSGSTSTLVDTSRVESTDYWVGHWVLFTSGPSSGQVRLITDFNAGTDTLTFSPVVSNAITTDHYEILPQGGVDLRLWAGDTPSALISGRVDSNAQVVGDKTGYSIALGGIIPGSIGAQAIGASSFANDAITSSVIAADAIGASELATDAVNEIIAAISVPAASTIASAVWSAARSTFNAAGTFGQGAASVQGSVTGSVGSIGAGGITNTSFEAGAIDSRVIAAQTIGATSFANSAITSSVLAADSIGATQIAADAIGSSELATTAVNEIVAAISIPAASSIASAVWTAARSTFSAAGSFGQGVASVQGNVTGSVGSIGTGGISAASFAAGAIDSAALASSAATEIADALLTRDWTAVTGEAARSVLNALRKLMNKWEISGSTLTVMEEDDTTPAYTQSISTNPSALPITSLDTA